MLVKLPLFENDEKEKFKKIEFNKNKKKYKR